MSNSKTTQLTVKLDGNPINLSLDRSNPVARHSASSRVSSSSTPPETNEALSSELARQLTELQNRQVAMRSQLLASATDLAATMVGKILKRQISADEFPLTEIAESILANLGDPRKVTVRVNPRDAIRVVSLQQVNEHITVLPDPAIRAGALQLSVDDSMYFLDPFLTLAELYSGFSLEELDVQSR